MLRDWLLIASAIACLWGLWLLLQFVFDSIDQYHAAWREEREREAAQMPPQVYDDDMFFRTMPPWRKPSHDEAATPLKGKGS